MKTSIYSVIIGISLSLLSFTFIHPKNCSIAGSTSDKREQSLNIEKNRSTAPGSGQIEGAISLEGMLNSKDDPTLFKENAGAVIEGYVFAVREGKAESGNCNSTDPKDWDYVLYVAKDDKAKEIWDCAVVEVTPATREMHPELTLAYLKSIKGKRVKITGWMMFNYKETQSSMATHPNAFKLDRKTAWEIHPVTALKTDE